MPELNEDNFELIDRNKDSMLQRNKLKYLQDRIETLEKSVAQLNEIIGELKNERL
jgi:prefoldin subunit 5